MEGIVNNPLSGQEYIQYGKFTFKNINTILPYSSQPLETPCFQWVPDF